MTHMPERHRLEDLGRITEKLEKLLEDDFWQFFRSKHEIDVFISHYENILDELHYKIRHIKDQLEEMADIAYGSE